MNPGLAEGVSRRRMTSALHSLESQADQSWCPSGVIFSLSESKTSSAMLQRMLLLAAFTAFTSALPPLKPSPQCSVAIDELQRAWENIFPRFSAFKHNLDDQSFPFDFAEMVSHGFHNVECFHNLDNQTVQLTLVGTNGIPADPSNDGALVKGIESSKSASILQGYDYAIDLKTHYDVYTPNSYSFCITDLLLNIIPDIGGNYYIYGELRRELKKQTQVLEKGAKSYFPVFAKEFTILLNEVLCKPHNASPTPTTDTTSSTSSTEEPQEGLLGSGCCGISHSSLLFDCCRNQSLRNFTYQPEVPMDRDCCQNFSRRPFVAV
ncbi:uncharacterized protein [Palaemon carinicauda]|uniref:uncharacterized protein n=1 Tax=Palaemon carinicauda TaxID=392227 RepID=UPI0035B61263